MLKNRPLTLGSTWPHRSPRVLLGLRNLSFYHVFSLRHPSSSAASCNKWFTKKLGRELHSDTVILGRVFRVFRNLAWQMLSQLLWKTFLAHARENHDMAQTPVGEMCTLRCENGNWEKQPCARAVTWQEIPCRARTYHAFRFKLTWQPRVQTKNCRQIWVAHLTASPSKQYHFTGRVVRLQPIWTTKWVYQDEL